ncbi:hypothetical protein [Flavobacterium kingsejongi]|uniref:Uncharacterized protein n=1 Tax=Flavobacterium kingsejongi TaxID=1678728 RepID=A0A2S1LNF4_9FLAO|nr:hypothetical protein [Flavobacterium kingsejongi]AWG25192.1 hypothetical protein FK004_08060 [Flavobacterium kingsejongi]
MKHKRNLGILFLISVVLSLLGFFSDSDLVVSSMVTKVIEIALIAIVIFIVLAILYFIMSFMLKTSTRVLTKNKKKRESQN